MAISKINNAKIQGIVCALPDNEISIFDLGKNYFQEKDIEKISEMSGVKRVFHAKSNQTASDLCYEAAERLLKELDWQKESVDGLLFISQTPDYITPSTACILQNKLGLHRNCIALDINLGCSGYVYGLWLASQFIQTKACSRVLVLVGDTLTRTISKQDKSVALIFGDGASATAIEYTEQNSTSTYILNSDGAGANSLIIPAGGFRMPASPTTMKLESDEDGNIRGQEHIYMNGMDIFSFAVKEIPQIIQEVINYHGWNIADVDQFLLHQANNYMLKFIGRKAKIPIEKMPLNIDGFGNTSGTTIPLLICDKLKDRLKGENLNIVMAGFGVGLSWGALAASMSQVHCTEIIYI
ncbi:3-oxoacyl-ACP synthase III family protein [Clostridium formicaceticum]|uniref:3-oxoacyl-[acyl-carrier-protein] synthase 3 n=1 Tax=Clostridium formicaceticum TaxID=1497 RepID=A0AAC9WEP6_9CLOT|nr:ketoacyl-ACP synthase III [Clostridium formicaceticum]AOY75652.1 hypothetical protein BJL90_06940 [Clostridium formicaceticum]ARE85966.1 3-oxoacyl-[acyl-carrier-protein] synthase 3 [Clostridium formicaceticum]